MTQVSDAFTDSNGTDITAHSAGGITWAKVGTGTLTIQSNALNLASISTFCGGMTGKIFSTSDQWASIDVTTDSVGPFVRGSYTGDGGTLYGAYWCQISGTTVYLYRINILFGTYTLITSAAAGGSSGTLRIEANGTTISVKVNGVQKISVTDSNITAGQRCGIFYLGNKSCDNFAAQDANITTATSYTFTGPSSGAINAASSNFTLSPVGGDWPTGQSISISSDGTGTFSNGGSVSPTGGNPVTFTYTPTTLAGSPHTISVNAGPDLGTDPASLDYAVLGYSTVSTSSPNGQAINVLVPVGYSATTGANIILYCHSNNGIESEVGDRTDANRAAFIDALIAGGYVIAGSLLNGNNWGNNAGLASLVDLYAYLVTNYRCLKTLLWGQSMGGLPALLAISDARIPRVKGVLAVVPVCNLAAMFDNNTGTYAATIRTAYGIAANGSDYSTLTAGHDPVLLDADVFENIGIMLISSPSDTIVDEAENATTFAALVDGVAYETTHLHHTGNHGDTSSHASALANAPAFFERCLAIPEGTGGGTNTDEWDQLRSVARSNGLELITQ